MIKIIMTYQREVIIFEINNKNIKYYDRKWQQGINFIPKEEGFLRKVIMSRNRLSSYLVDWMNEANTGKSIEEWNSCNTDEEVAQVVIRDAKLKGCLLQKIIKEDNNQHPEEIACKDGEGQSDMHIQKIDEGKQGSATGCSEITSPADINMEDKK